MSRRAPSQDDDTQQKMSAAMSRANAAMTTANSVMMSVDQNNQSQRSGTMGYSGSIEDAPNKPPVIITTEGAATKTTPTTSTPRSQGLDLQNNDSQFGVIASLIIDKFEDALRSGATSVTVTAAHKQQLDRMVSRQNFVEALRYRLQYKCPADSTKPIHVTALKCRALGLHRDGDQNLLYAPAGTVIHIEVTADVQMAVSVDESFDGNPENMARQQLLAELREASNLMAESVTPEAAQFWRKHVVELQSRLRALHENKGTSNNSNNNTDDHVTGDAEEIMRSNELLLASLNENASYVPPSPDDASVNNSPASPGYRTRSPLINNFEQQRQFQSQQQVQSRQAPISTMDPNMQGSPMVDVVAPADLPGGYTFEAEIEDRRFLAIVPAGGVHKGETFSCYMRDLDVVSSEIPLGRWRDSPKDCFKYGIFHPLVLNTIFCPLLALAQIMTRMGFDNTGRPSNDIAKQGLWSAYGMTFLTLGFWLFLNIIVLIGFNIKNASGVAVSTADVASLFIVNVAMMAFTVYAAANTRGSIREKYLIREHRFIDLEDCLCATFCLPCTICQMGRHTASYEDYNGVCCNDTGVPAGVQLAATQQQQARFSTYIV